MGSSLAVDSLAGYADAGEAVCIISLADGQLFAGIEHDPRAVDAVDKPLANEKGFMRAHEPFVEELLFQPHHRGVELEAFRAVINRDDALLNLEIADVLYGDTAALARAGEHEHLALAAGFPLASAQEDFLKLFGGGLILEHIVQRADVVAVDGISGVMVKNTMSPR